MMCVLQIIYIIMDTHTGELILNEILKMNKELLKLKHTTEHNFEDLSEMMRLAGNCYQDHEDRVAALENASVE